MGADEDRCATADGEQLCWITGCCVGAAHPPARASADAIAWHLIEHPEESAAAQGPTPRR